MAELSIETQAILDRLKKEGDLLRNSGTNSIKSVKVELSKFENIFSTISTSIEGQIETLREAAGFSQDAAIAQQRQNELLAAAGVSEQERAELEKRRFQTEQLKADQDYKDQEEREKARQKQEKGFFNKLGGFFSAQTFGKMISGIKIAAIAGLGLAVGYQFVAGVLEGMGVDVKKFEEGFVDGVNNFIKFVKDVEWSKLGETLNMLAGPEALAAAVGLSLLPTALDAAGDIALTTAAIGALRRTGTSPDVDGPDRTRTPPADGPDGRGQGRGAKAWAGMKSLLSWRTALISAIGTGLIAYSGEIGEFFKEDASNVSKSDIMNTPVDSTASNVSIIAGAANLGLLFGPKGALVASLVAGAYVIGKTLYEVVDDAINDLGNLPNELESVLKTQQNPQLRRRAQLQAQRTGQTIKTFEEVAVGTIENLNTEIEQSVAELEELKNKPIDTKGLSRGGAQAALRRRENAIKDLEEKIALRQKQLETTEQVLLQRREEGIADFDVYTPGTQTQAEFEVNQKKRDEAARRNREYVEKYLAEGAASMGLDLPPILNPMATRAESMDSGWQAPLILQIDQSTTVGGSTINARSSTGGSYVLRAEGGTGGVSKTVLPGGLK